MRDQDAFISFADVNVSLNQITAAADVGRDFCGKVAHSSVEEVAFACGVNASSIGHKTFAKAIVERQHPCGIFGARP
jgi:hypothetical protein